MADKRTPLILCGKIPTHQAAVTKAIDAEFEVVRICPSIEELQVAVNEYFHTTTEAPKPQVILMGGGFSQQEFEDAIAFSAAIRPATDPSETSSASDECQVTWFRPAHVAPGASGKPPTNGPPSAEVTAKLCHDGLWKHLDELKSGATRGKVIYF